MKYVVNSYDLNGKHTLLDENNRPILFNSEGEVSQYLKSKGCSEEFINSLSINEATDEDLEVFISTELL